MHQEAAIQRETRTVGRGMRPSAGINFPPLITRPSAPAVYLLRRERYPNALR